MADTSVVASALLGESNSEAAWAVLRLDDDWHAPRLWRSEFANILATRMRGAELMLDGALSLHGSAARIFEGGEHDVSASEVLPLAARSRCSAYDCEYVALALDLRVPLLTWDRAILRAFPQIAMAPEEFVAAAPE